MAITSKWRGHDIVFDKECNLWRYVDTGVPTQEDPHRKCGHCELESSGDYDECIGFVIGVRNACCGHGEVKDAYVQFLDGETVHGEDASVILNVLKKYQKGVE